MLHYCIISIGCSNTSSRPTEISNAFNMYESSLNCMLSMEWDLPRWAHADLRYCVICRLCKILLVHSKCHGHFLSFFWLLFFHNGTKWQNKNLGEELGFFMLFYLWMMKFNAGSTPDIIINLYYSKSDNVRLARATFQSDLKIKSPLFHPVYFSTRTYPVDARTSPPSQQLLSPKAHLPIPCVIKYSIRKYW